MTAFRPGQRVRVAENDWEYANEIGTVEGVHPDTSVAVQLDNFGHVWFDHDQLALIGIPGIPAHLYPSNARHLPLWVGRKEWRR